MTSDDTCSAVNAAPVKRVTAWSAGPVISIGLALAVVAGACVGDTGDMELRWTITGSLEDPDDSLDTCADVGAAQARIRTVSGPRERDDVVVPCVTTQGQLHYMTDVDLGTWGVSLQLLDDTGSALTAPVERTVEVTALRGMGRYAFPPGVFRDVDGQPLQLEGTYRFRVTYDGRSCGRMVNPPPERQLVRLLDAAGQVVDAQVCFGEECAATTGNDPLPCVTGELEQSIAKLPWGEYKIELSGQTKSGSTCWAGAWAIVVGAGDNPVFQHDVALRPGCS